MSVKSPALPKTPRGAPYRVRPKSSDSDYVFEILAIFLIDSKRMSTSTRSRDFPPAWRLWAAGNCQYNADQAPFTETLEATDRGKIFPVSCRMFSHSTNEFAESHPKRAFFFSFDAQEDINRFRTGTVKVVLRHAVSITPQLPPTVFCRSAGPLSRGQSGPGSKTLSCFTAIPNWRLFTGASDLAWRGDSTAWIA